MKVVAVTVNWNRADLTRKAVLSVQRSVAAVVVVDNGSSAQERATLQELAHLGSEIVFVWLPTNVGYAAGANRGIEQALALLADAVLVMNNDVEAEPGAVEKLIGALGADSSIGIVMPTVADASGTTVLHTACGLDARTGRPSWLDHGMLVESIDRTPRETGYVSGEAFLAGADVLRASKGFDERYVSYFEDVDLSVRVWRAGRRLEVLPEAIFRHALGGSGAAARGIYFRARNQTLLLHWALGFGKPRSIVLGGRTIAEMALRLAARRTPRLALAAAKGWAAGALLLVTDRPGTSAAASPENKSTEAAGPAEAAEPVFLFDSDGMNPYGFVTAEALDAEGVSLRYARRNAHIARSLGSGFGPARGGRGGRRRRLVRAMWLSGSLFRTALGMRTASVAHFLWESPADALLALLARHVFRKRVVVTIHDPTRSRLTMRSARYLLVRSADRVVMHSEALASILLTEHRSLHRDELLVAPLPSYAVLARDRSAADARRELGFDEEAELILFFGQLRPEKGLFTFATACKSLLSERPALHVLVAGVSASPEAEADLSVRLGGPSARVRLFVGSTPLAEGTLLSLIEAADLAVLPLDWASQSSSSVLALSLGCALVTTAAGENAALALAGAAAIIPIRDPAALASTCARLLDSPAERSDLAERGAAYARETLDPSLFARALVREYGAVALDGG